MTNGEKIQTILDVDRDCTEVHGENGTMTLTVTQDFWNTEYREPKTDTWSIKEVADSLKRHGLIREQEPKTGHWIYGIDEDTGEKDLYAWTCSECEGKYPWQPKYCPNCGAKMESEVKEHGSN